MEKDCIKDHTAKPTLDMLLNQISLSFALSRSHTARCLKTGLQKDSIFHDPISTKATYWAYEDTLGITKHTI
jgi:hypothetical protein